MDNLSEQCEEIEALKSIYDKSFKVETATNSYSMQITSNIQLFFTLNENYPSNAPPNYELLAPVLTSDQKLWISNKFQEIYENNMGGPVLFQWIEELKDIVENENLITDNANETSTNSTNESDKCEKQEDSKKTEIYLDIIHGDIIQDRKSVFQAHVAQVYSLEDTKSFINILLKNKKIAQATHNIAAYIVVTSKGAILQDCDDDGETHAGGRILHLLQILNLKNVMVVVTRWYGGTHLGPDRFKHITNAARQVLVQGGFLLS